MFFREHQISMYALKRRKEVNGGWQFLLLSAIFILTCAAIWHFAVLILQPKTLQTVHVEGCKKYNLKN